MYRVIVSLPRVCRLKCVFQPHISVLSEIEPALLFWQSGNFAKTLLDMLIPHQRHPQAPVPSLPLRRWYDPKARRFVCLGKENILWGQVKQDVLECGPSLLLALCNNALCGADAHTNVCTCVRTYTSDMPYLTNHILGFGKCLSDRPSSCIYLKSGVCWEQACLSKALRWENVKR